MPIPPRNLPRSYRALDGLKDVPERLRGAVRSIQQDVFDLRDAVLGQQALRTFAYQKNSGQAVSNGVTTALTFDTNLWDTANIHVKGTQFVARANKPALYLAVGQWRFDTGGAGGHLHMEIQINRQNPLNPPAGPFVFTDQLASAGFTIVQQISGPLLLNPGDFIEFYVAQNIGNGHTLTMQTFGSLSFISF